MRRRGNLVKTDEHHNSVLFATMNGAVGVLAEIPQSSFNFFWRLQNILREVRGYARRSTVYFCIKQLDWSLTWLEVTVPVGNLKQQAYRSPHAPIGGASDCFIDGDLIRLFFSFLCLVSPLFPLHLLVHSSYMELPAAQKMAIAAEFSMSPEDLTLTIEHFHQTIV